jgi:hypothetical protein
MGKGRISTLFVSKNGSGGPVLTSSAVPYLLTKKAFEIPILVGIQIANFGISVNPSTSLACKGNTEGTPEIAITSHGGAVETRYRGVRQLFVVGTMI